MQRRIRHFLAAAALYLWSSPLGAQPPPEEPPEEPPPEPAPEPRPEEPLVPPPEPKIEPKPEPKPKAPPEKTAAVAKKPEAAGTEEEQPINKGKFTFGSYGRVIAATDLQGRPPRDADIVAHGSRLDHENYVELELRRDDHWFALDADTRFVATLALGHPVFHYDGEFDVRLAVRNLYAEERNIGLEGLSFWAGSRMLRGDDIYLLDFWPLDNLNTLGAGLGYEAKTHTKAHIHVG
ncbi:MAG TPA: carbohydrate porin, partial [Polyangiaceae bacterium]|nr:carbohydrate porin [Polyangiaceae bacterium]